MDLNDIAERNCSLGVKIASLMFDVGEHVSDQVWHDWLLCIRRCLYNYAGTVRLRELYRTSTRLTECIVAIPDRSDLSLCWLNILGDLRLELRGFDIELMRNMISSRNPVLPITYSDTVELDADIERLTVLSRRRVVPHLWTGIVRLLLRHPNTMVRIAKVGAEIVGAAIGTMVRTQMRDVFVVWVHHLDERVPDVEVMSHVLNGAKQLCAEAIIETDGILSDDSPVWVNLRCEFVNAIRSQATTWTEWLYVMVWRLLRHYL